MASLPTDRKAPVLLLDSQVVLSPRDLPHCEFGLLRKVAELRGLVAPVQERVFMPERVRRLTVEQRARALREYRRTYSRTFVELDPPQADSLGALRGHHERTMTELRSLRAVAGGGLIVDLAPGVLLHSEPVMLMLGSVADEVTERFATAGDVARLGVHAHALETATGQPVPQAALHLNNDRRRTYSGEELAAVARPRLEHVARLVGGALQADGPWEWGDTGVSACGFCAHCRAAAEEHRDVQLVWGMRRAPREVLRRAGVTTIDALADTSEPPGQLDKFSWSRFRARARLQLRQEQEPGRVFSQVHDPAALAALPDPSPGDIFFDFEGDPFWVERNRFEWGLEFLFGFIAADTGEYTALWSANQAEEKAAFERFLEILARRREHHPDMHVYHFAFYEPAKMRQLARRHRTGQKVVNQLLDGGVFVDLYETVKAGVHISQRSYGLKALEPLYMGVDLRTSDVADGGEAVVSFERAVRARSRGESDTAQEIFDDLADYNRYDCESTRRLRDWLLEQRDQSGDGESLARELLGATTQMSELLLTPLEEPTVDVGTPVRIPGFDEPGVFYVSSGNSTDALGAEHKTHELLGRWGSGSRFQLGQDVLVGYSDPRTGATDSTGLVTRSAELLECADVGDGQRVLLREATPSHDPDTKALVPVLLESRPLEADPGILKRAKRFTYSIISGPAGSGKSELAMTETLTDPAVVVIDDAHLVTLAEGVRIAEAEDAEHVVVVGDPALAAPTGGRGLPGELAGAPLLTWLLGESGATIRERTAVQRVGRFHPELGGVLQRYLYEGVELIEPLVPTRLLPDDLTGVHVRTVEHRGNRDTSPEEGDAVAALLEQLLAAGPLTESDVIVTAVHDSQTLLLQRRLGDRGVRVLPFHELGGEEAAVSIISIGSSTLADAPFGGTPAVRSALAPLILGAALTRAREAAFVVCSAHLLEQLPPRAATFPDVARFVRVLAEG